MYGGFIHKCAGVIRSCWRAFKSEPFSVLINSFLLSIAAIGVDNLLPLLAVGFAVTVDIITGAVKARRNETLEFTSKDLKRKLIDIIVYSLVILLTLTLSLWADWMIIFSWLTSGFIMWVELESIRENMQAAGYNVGWLGKLLEAFKQTLDDIVNNISSGEK